jgi:hypothetical protein
MDLKEILVLDSIDIAPDGFRVRSHDLHGPLPEIVIKNSGDTLQDKDRLGNETYKLIAILKLRKWSAFWPGCKLISRTSVDGKVIVGLRAKPMTLILEGENFISA